MILQKWFLIKKKNLKIIQFTLLEINMKVGEVNWNHFHKIGLNAEVGKNTI